MDPTLLPRRVLLKWAGAAWAASAATAPLPTLASAAISNRADNRFATLSAATAASLDAIAARILPTTETPGAREAGAVWFMDAALGDAMADSLDFVEAGVAELNAKAGGSFATLPEARQDELLTSIEEEPFFGLVHFLTLAGTFTMPRYGGNRDEVGWDILGFERGAHWNYPLGYYDRAVHGASPEAHATHAHAPAPKGVES